MYSFFRRYLLSFALMMVSIQSFAYWVVVTEDGKQIFLSQISKEDKTCEISNAPDYAQYEGVLRVPETAVNPYDGGETYTIVGVGSGAFNGCTKPIQLYLPPTVTTIKGTDLRCITLLSCTSNVTSIADDIKSWHGALYMDDLKYYCGSDAFKLCHPSKLYINDELVSSLVFPKDIDEVYESRFYDNYGLTEVFLLDNVKTIGKSAFQSCKNLEYVYIGDGVKTIPMYAFRNCSKIKKMYIGSSVTQIEAQASMGADIQKLFIFSSDLSKLGTNAIPSTVNCIYVPVPSDYASLLSDYNVQPLLTFRDVPLEYSGVERNWNYTNNVWDAKVTFDDDKGPVNVGHYNVNRKVTFTIGEWSSSCIIPCVYTITKAPLSVLAKDAVREYGAPNPEFDCLITGFKNNENETVLTRIPTCTTTADLNSLPGTYPIVPSGGEAQNYSFEYERGTLTITKASNTLTWDQNIQPLEIGESITVNYTASKYQGNPIFSEFDSNIIDITKVGDSWMIKAKSLGTTTVTLKLTGNELYNESNEAKVTVTVKAPLAVEAESILLNKTSISVNVGTFESLTAVVFPENTTDKTIIWTSNDESIAKVSSSGVVIGVGVGHTFVQATCGQVSATCSVAVLPVEASGVYLDKNSLNMLVGDQQQLTATVVPDSTTDKTIEWESSDSNVATVDDNGLVKALGVGSSTISATCGSVKATCRVKVSPIAATAVELDRTEATVFVGESGKLAATVKPENATDKTVRWSTSDSNVVTIEQDGSYSAVKAGNATITATCGAVSASCDMTVKNVEAESIILNRSNVKLLLGQSITVTATVKPDNTTIKDVEWSTSDASVATVNDSGEIVAVGIGGAEITAVCGAAKASCAVQVNPVPSEGVIINTTSLSLKVGESEKLIATVLPESTTDKAVVWTSTDYSVATVDQNGLVTALAPGDAVIVATNGGFSATCQVDVSAILVESISFESDRIDIPIGESRMLNVVVLPDNATNKRIAWASCDPSIGSVSDEGLVTVLSPGEFIVTAATTDGSDLTASCIINKMSGVDAIFTNGNISVLTAEHTIFVHGKNPADKVAVYASDGSLLYWGVDNRIDVANCGFYIVKVADKTFKVMLR